VRQVFGGNDQELAGLGVPGELVGGRHGALQGGRVAGGQGLVERGRAQTWWRGRRRWGIRTMGNGERGVHWWRDREGKGERESNGEKPVWPNSASLHPVFIPSVDTVMEFRGHIGFCCLLI